MSRLRAIAGDQAGFTIAEYITAIAILLTVVIGAMSALAYAGTASAGTARREEGINLANKQIEQARNQPYDNLGASWPGSNPVESGDYTVDTRVTWARDASNRSTCRVVTVTVSWQTPRPGEVTVSTRIFGKSEISNTGDVLVNVVQALENGTTEPMPGASVTLTASVGPSQRVITDGSGGAFFGHVGAGSFSFEAKRAGWVIDHSAYVTPPTVAGGSTTTCQVTAHKPSSHRFTFAVPGHTTVPAVGVGITGVKPNPMVTKTVNGNETLFSNLLPDNYSVTFSPPVGYQLEAGTPTNFSIAQGNTNSGTTVNLVKNSLLVVTVYDDRGSANPVAGASLTLSGPTSGAATTDSAGKATFAITATGTYTVFSSKSDFVSATTNRTIALGADDECALSMARYGTLRCTYPGTTKKTLYVYDSNKVRVATGQTSGVSGSNRRDFSLPPADFYYVSTRSSWPASTYTPVQTGEVVSGATTTVAVVSTN